MKKVGKRKPHLYERIHARKDGRHPMTPKEAIAWIEAHGPDIYVMRVDILGSDSSTSSRYWKEKDQMPVLKDSQ